MPSVYVLQHSHADENGNDDVKFIGVYSSREKAQSAVARISRASGFSDELDGFNIDEYPMDQDHWVEGYVPLANAEMLLAASVRD